MHVVQFTTALSRSAAGVYEAVIGLTRSLCELPATRVTVVGAVLEPSRWHEDYLTWIETGARVHAVQVQSVKAAKWLWDFASSLPVNGVDIVHAHGIWNGSSLAAHHLASRCDSPLVISPHGMLEPWAFQHRRWKKVLPWQLWERRILLNATMLQAMSELEADGFAQVGLHNPVCVQGIGLDQGNIRRHSSRPGEIRTCLFLSRIHPKKGLPMLIEAWASLAPRNWRLVIAGPDEVGHLAELQAQIQNRKVADCITFIGATYGEEKWELLSAADLFVLPSHSENFGIVVAEAMAAGLPVLTTTATPWRILQDERIGWWVPPTVSGITDALAQALALPSEDLAAMGMTAANVGRSRFDWAVIARSMRDAYTWAIRGGTPPCCLSFHGQTGACQQ